MEFWPQPIAPASDTARVFGYARVSTDDQRLDMQLDALGKSGCLQVFYDHGVSGAKAERPGLDVALDTLTPGGKLVFHIFAAIAEFHRDLIRENTRNGLAAARRRGARLGRPPKLTVDQILEAHRLIHQEGYPLARLMAKLGVSESTLIRGFRRLNQLELAADK